MASPLSTSKLADAFLCAGFALGTAGVYLLWGTGITCVTAGLVLFLAGGLTAAREGR